MLRWAILGTSFISGTVAEAIAASDGSATAIVAGRNPDRLADFQAQHAIPRATTDFDAAVANTDVDVVYIGLPSHLHTEFAIKAAARGKAVLSEKSLTVDMPSARALIGGVQAHGTFFVEGLMYLAHPLYARLTGVLADGRLGQIRTINARYAADIWRFVNPLGKGTIYNLGCYPASLLHFVMQKVSATPHLPSAPPAGMATYRAMMARYATPRFQYGSGTACLRRCIPATVTA